MIQLSQLAKMFEDGLNAVFGDPDVHFKIWADVGKETRPVRTGNTVSCDILGNLRTTSSANDANALVMGVNSLALDFSVPLRRPWTNLAQTEDGLQDVQEGQYLFVEQVKAVIDEYFQRVQIFSEKVGDVDVTMSLQAGSAVTGNVDLAAQLHTNVIISVYVTLYYLEGGINSKDVVFEVDGESVPFQTLVIGRRGAISSDVYSNRGETQNYLSSSAVSVDFTFPANSDRMTSQVVDFLLRGSKNVARFVHFKYGAVDDHWLLMTFSTADTSLAGITFAGLSGSLITAADEIELLDFPAAYQVFRVKLSASTAKQIDLSVTSSGAVPLYMAGNFYQPQGGSQAVSVAVDVDDGDYVYDPDEDAYYVYGVTMSTAYISSAQGTVEVVKPADLDDDDIPVPDVPDYYQVAVAEVETRYSGAVNLTLGVPQNTPVIIYWGWRSYAVESADGTPVQATLYATQDDYVQHTGSQMYYFYLITNAEVSISADNLTFKVLQTARPRPATPPRPDLPSLPSATASEQIAAIVFKDTTPSSMTITLAVAPVPGASALTLTCGGQDYFVRSVSEPGMVVSVEASLRAQDFVFDAENDRYLVYVNTTAACGMFSTTFEEVFIAKEVF